MTQGGLDNTQPKIFSYTSTDATTVITDTTGYFSDGYGRGMRVNDLVFASKSDGTTVPVVSLRVTSASSSGPCTCGSPTSIGTT